MSSFLKNPTVQIVAGYFPKVTTIILAVVSFALGMVWAYVISPVSFVNGEPVQLEQTFQNEWVLGVAGRYANRNAAVDARIQQLLEQVDDPAGIANQLRALPPDSPYYTPEIEQYLNTPGFQGLVDAAQANAKSAPPPPTIINNYVMPLVVVLVFAILLTLGKVLWTLLIFPFLEPILSGRNKSEASKQIDLIKEKKLQEEEMMSTAVDTTKYGDPIIRKLSVYKAGFGNYDDSFNIETAAGMYYGEAGGAISEKIGDDGVTAIEVWMFDKDEFANTPTVIFASEHAYNDPAIRSRLEPKGELVKMAPGATAILETNGLYVEAKVREVNYEADQPVPNSVLQSSTIEIIAWAKSGGPGAAGGSTPMPAAVPPAQTPPPPAAPPAGGSQFAPPPAPAPQTPLAPPPMGNPNPGGGAPFPPPQSPPAQSPPSPFGGNEPPDDPFGGTGDFTPVNPND